MRQEALVTEDGKIARVLVMRAPACTGECEGCGGCSEARPLRVDARNDINAKKGQYVTVETDTGSVLRAAALVYLLPLAVFLIAYFAAQALGAGPALTALCAAAAAVLSFLFARRFDRKQAGKPVCAIVAIREDGGDQ